MAVIGVADCTTAGGTTADGARRDRCAEAGFGMELPREPTTAVLRGADACWAARLLAGVDTAVEELVD